VVGTPAAHSRASTPVRAGVTVRAAGISGFARRLRSETVPRARELRRRGSATVTVGARRRGKTSATPVVLHGDRVVLGAVVARRAVGAVGVGVLLVGAAAGADGADEGGEEEDAADDDDGDDDALVHACFGGGVAGVKGVEVVGWGGGAGVEGCAAGGCSAAVGCAHGTGALLDSAHDSGGGGHVETGCHGGGGVGGSSGAGNSRVVAAGVHHVKMHVRDGGVFVGFVVVERLPVSFLEFGGCTARVLSYQRESMMRANQFPSRGAASFLYLGRVLYVKVNKECRRQRRHIDEQRRFGKVKRFLKGSLSG
jgi:hypothetical protein